MTTKEILNLDCREKENEQKIQKVLLKIKPLMKYSDEKVPIDALDKLIYLICNRYKVWVRRIMQSPLSSDDGNVWSCQIVETNNLDIIQEIFGVSIYEVFAKTVIYLWSMKEKDKLVKRK